MSITRKTIVYAFSQYVKMLNLLPSKSPMTWDMAKSQLQWDSYKTSKNRRSILLWHLNYVITVHIVYSSAIVYFILEQLYGWGPKRELLNMIFPSLLAVLHCYGCSMHVMTVFYGQDAVNGWNKILRIEAELVTGKLQLYTLLET